MVKVKGVSTVRGVVRALDDLGRVVIPKEMRRSLKLETGDLVDIYVENGIVCIAQIKLQCALCGSREEDELGKVDGVYICFQCAEKIMEVMN